MDSIQTNTLPTQQEDEVIISNEENAPKINELLSSLLTSIPNDLDVEDKEQDNDMQQLLANVFTSINSTHNGNNQEESNNQEENNKNMQQMLSSMLTSMNGISGKQDGNINDLFSKLLGNMTNTEETLDDDYILSGEEDEDDCCEGCDGCDMDNENVMSEDDFKEIITSFNEANMMNNFKAMFEILSKKIPQPIVDTVDTVNTVDTVDTVDTINTCTNMEDVD
jgi:hypothetical protein